MLATFALAGLAIASARPALAQTGNPCHLLTSSQSVPEGFGAAYNLFSAAKEVILAVTCGPTSNATLDVGNGQSTMYVYRFGYEWVNGSWQQIALSGSELVANDWYVGTAKANLFRSQAQLAEDNFVLTYTCLWQNNSWKCGCRDTSCSTNYWQLQEFRMEAPPPSGDLGGTGGEFSNVTCSKPKYWVSRNGSDGNNGIRSNPFRTIQKGLDVAKAGETVAVMPGNYGNAPSTFRTSGSSGKPMCLVAEFPATENEDSKWATITGSGSGNGIVISGRQHVVLDGFSIQRYNVGIQVRSSSNVVVRRNVIGEHNATGVHIGGTGSSGDETITNVWVEKNKIHDLVPNPGDKTVQTMDYGVKVAQLTNSSKDIRVIGNLFQGRFNHNISLKSGGTGTYIGYNTFEGCRAECMVLGQEDDKGRDQTTISPLVEHNIIRPGNVGGTGFPVQWGINVVNANDTIVRNNFVIGAQVSAIEVHWNRFNTDDTHRAYGIKPIGAKIYGNIVVGATESGIVLSSRGHTGDNIDVYNNTIHDSNVAVWVTPWRFGQTTSATETTNPPNVRFYNNSVSNSSTGFKGPTGTVTFRNNNWYQSGSRQHSSDLTANPMFQGSNTSQASSFRLRSGSSLIDVGTNVGLPYSGSAPDISANEFIAQ